MTTAEANIEKNYISLEQKDRLLYFLREEYGLDFTEYAEASIRRRIAKILNELRFSDVGDYINSLLHNPFGKQVFLEKFTVNVTEMFRDPDAFEILNTRVLNQLRHKETFRIWSAGCSSGEEVLSLCILLYENGLLDKAEIIATDIAETVLQKAKWGRYTTRHVLTYEKAYRDCGGRNKLTDYYKELDGMVQFDPRLLKRVTFKAHNLMEQPTEEGFDLIMCRNVLIYFTASLQDRVLHHLDQALLPCGHIMLGSRESMIFYKNQQYFKEIEAATKIFRKRG